MKIGPICWQMDFRTALAICLDKASDHEPATWEAAARELRNFSGPDDLTGRGVAQLCEIKAAIRRAESSAAPVVIFEHAAKIGI